MVWAAPSSSVQVRKSINIPRGWLLHDIYLKRRQSVLRNEAVGKLCIGQVVHLDSDIYIYNLLEAESYGIFMDYEWLLWHLHQAWGTKDRLNWKSLWNLTSWKTESHDTWKTYKLKEILMGYTVYMYFYTYIIIHTLNSSAIWGWFPESWPWFPGLGRTVRSL